MASASACILLFLLLLVKCTNGSESDDMNLEPKNVLRLPVTDYSNDVPNNNHHHHHHHHHYDHVNDPSVRVFFTLDDLKQGSRMEIYFSKKTPGSTPKFLPREEADSLPFSLKQLPFLLNLFSFSQDSPQAKAMESTLRECQVIKPIKGETKFCATSIESMLDFAQTIFNSNSSFNILTTTYITHSSTLFQNYTVLGDPVEISAPKMVACHVKPYPYGVYYCHSQVSESKVFRVPLIGDNGDEVDAVAVCHMDTSQWSPSHVSFRVLVIQPGSSHVCHFFPAGDLVMVSNMVN